MDTDIAQLASATVAAISPFAPFLLQVAKEGGKKLAQVMAEHGGKASWETAQNVWNKIKTELGDDPEVQGAAMMVSANPEEGAYRSLLEKALEKRITEDPGLAHELLESLGGQKALQKILAERGSRIEDASQEMGTGGTQVIRASDRSTIKGVRQSKK